MKTNTETQPLHLTLEYLFRHQYFLLFMLAFLLLAIIKTDSRILSLMRETYAQGFGLVGQYMREETTRVPVTFNIGARIPTVSGK